MNNYINLNHYVLPPELLIKLTDLYQEIGKTDNYLNSLNDYKYQLEKRCLLIDTMYLSKLFNLDINISDYHKVKQIIDKSNNTKNQTEKIITNIYEALELIKNDSTSYNLNASETIAILNKIYQSKKIKYSETSFKAIENKNKVNYTSRFLINESFDNYDEYIKNKKYEKIILTSILILDQKNINGFSDYNNEASLLILYYQLLRQNINIIKYVSLFELIYQMKEKIDQDIITSSMNYWNGYLNPTDFILDLVDILIRLYQTLKEEVHKYSYKAKGLKSDNIIQSILQLPEFFTKDDVRKLNPEASETTINRALVKLKENEIIMPLGTGRSAMWRKSNEALKDIDLSKLLSE